MLVPGLLSILCCLLLWGWVTSASAFKRVCYFTNWSSDLLIPEAHFELEDIDPRLCSHVIFAFAKINTSTFQLLPTRTDDEGEDGETGIYVLFNDLKKTHPSLVTMLSVGGSLQANAGFAKVVATVGRRRDFARNCVEFLRLWGFDGLDVDWEYPGDPIETRTNFTLLLLELRKVFEEESAETGRQTLILSLAAPVSEALMTRGYEIAKVSSLVDFINVMAYDFHGAWNKITGFNAPLFPRQNDPQFQPDLNVQWAVDTWIARGAPKEKLVIGIAGYGASYSLASNISHGVGAPVSGPGRPGPYRLMEGQLSFYEICELIEKGGGVYVWDNIQKVPYVYTNDTWVGFDDQRSVAIKTQWMIEKGLGGVMIWSLDLDDYKGTYCHDDKYPLLKSIVKTAARYFDDISIPPTETTAHSTTTTTTATTTVAPTSTTETSTTRLTSPTQQRVTPKPRATTPPKKVRTTEGNFIITTRSPTLTTSVWDENNLPPIIPTKDIEDTDDTDDNDNIDIRNPGDKHGDIHEIGNTIVGQDRVETDAASGDNSKTKNIGVTDGASGIIGSHFYLFSILLSIVVEIIL